MMRVSYSGITRASQAREEGSIPFTRSNSLPTAAWPSFPILLMPNTMLETTPELERWLEESIDRGCSPQSMIDAMIAVGHQPGAAQRCVASAFTKYHPEILTTLMASEAGREAVQILRQHVQEQPGTYVDAAPLTHILDPAKIGPNRFVVDQQQITVTLNMTAPRIAVFDNLLSALECDALIELSEGKLDCSKTVDAQTGQSLEHEDRRSQGTYFRKGENPLVSLIDARIATLLDWPVSHGEDLQILRYTVGGEYKPHFDYFDPTLAGSGSHLLRGGQRIATLVIYLNDVLEGGATIFPSCGLEIRPKRGSAVYFSYQMSDGSVDSMSLHGGGPVLVGEKWIATKWLREQPFI